MVSDAVVDVRYAFSKEKDHKRCDGCGYVSERMIKDKELIRELWRQGARIYVCGSRKFEKTIGDAAMKIVLDATRGNGNTDEDAEQWFEKVAAGRIASDCFE